MIDPISLIIFALGSVVFTAGIIAIYILSIVALVELLENWANDNYVDEDDTGFVTKALKSGNCTHVQGVWNKRTNKVRGAWKIKANNVDSNMKSMLEQNEVVLID